MFDRVFFTFYNIYFKFCLPISHIINEVFPGLYYVYIKKENTFHCIAQKLLLNFFTIF